MDIDVPQNSIDHQFSGEKFRRYLVDELNARIKNNSRYSMRAFAQSLAMHPSTLSPLLAGKRSLTYKAILKIAGRLGLSKADIDHFTFEGAKQPRVHSVEADIFALMADWYHYAILEATSVNGFDLTIGNVARSFDISTVQAGEAIHRLERLGLLVKIEGRYVKTKRFLTNLSSVNTSAAHKELQRQIIAKALRAVDEIPQEEKDISSITFSINEKRLPEARELIKDFRRRLGTLLGGDSATRVYKLGVQLFPVSKRIQRTDIEIEGVV